MAGAILTMRRRARATTFAGVTALLLAAGVFLPAASSPAAAASVLLSAGHVDALFAVDRGDGTIALLVKDDTGASPVMRNPDSVLFHVHDGARSVLPPGAGFIGPEGSTAWILPQAQQFDVLWLGWGYDAAGRAGPAVRFDAAPTLRLLGGSGPGTVEVYTTGAFGDFSRLFSTTAGLPNAIAAGDHVHANWAFSAPGAYSMTFQLDGVRNGAAISTPPATINLVVGPLDGGPGPVPDPEPEPEPEPNPEPEPEPGPGPGPTAPPQGGGGSTTSTTVGTTTSSTAPGTPPGSSTGSTPGGSAGGSTRGPGPATPSGTAGQRTSGSIPETGSSPLAPIGIATALLAIGVAAWFTHRRRTASA